LDHQRGGAETVGLFDIEQPHVQRCTCAYLRLLGILGDVGRLAAAVGIDMKDSFSVFEHFNPGQTLPQRAKAHQRGQV
jgi:hypothetical protein